MSLLGDQIIEQDRNMYVFTRCPRSGDPVDIVTYYIKWVKTSWTNISNFKNNHFGKLYLRDDKLDKN